MLECYRDPRKIDKVVNKQEPLVEKKVGNFKERKVPKTANTSTVVSEAVKIQVSRV